MLSVYFACVGLGGVGLGLGLLVQGPLALDKRWTRQKSDSDYATLDDSIDLHADRQLGRLDGRADEVWRPVATVHFWTLAAGCFGVAGLAATAAGLGSNGALGTATAVGLVLGYVGARVLRALPAGSQG